MAVAEKGWFETFFTRQPWAEEHLALPLLWALGEVLPVRGTHAQASVYSTPSVPLLSDHTTSPLCLCTVSPSARLALPQSDFLCVRESALPFRYPPRGEGQVNREWPHLATCRRALRSEGHHGITTRCNGRREQVWASSCTGRWVVRERVVRGRVARGQVVHRRVVHGRVVRSCVCRSQWVLPLFVCRS